MDLALFGMSSLLFGTLTIPIWNSCIKDKHYEIATMSLQSNSHSDLKKFHHIFYTHLKDHSDAKNKLLYSATLAGNIPAIKLLLLYKANPNALVRTNKGPTPLLFSALDYHTQNENSSVCSEKLCKIIALLCKAGANPNEFLKVNYSNKRKDKHRERYRVRFPEILDLENIQDGIYFNYWPYILFETKEFQKETILHRMIKHLNEKSLSVIPTLLEHGADPSLIMYNGNTPLHLLNKSLSPSLESKKTYLVWLLLSNGAIKSLETFNWQKNTPINVQDDTTNCIKPILDTLTNRKITYKKVCAMNCAIGRNYIFVEDIENLMQLLPASFPSNTSGLDFNIRNKYGASKTLLHREIGASKRITSNHTISKDIPVKKMMAKYTPEINWRLGMW